jgi:hypothetical protein
MGNTHDEKHDFYPDDCYPDVWFNVYIDTTLTNTLLFCKKYKSKKILSRKKNRIYSKIDNNKKYTYDKKYINNTVKYDIIDSIYKINYNHTKLIQNHICTVGNSVVNKEIHKANGYCIIPTDIFIYIVKLCNELKKPMRSVSKVLYSILKPRRKHVNYYIIDVNEIFNEPDLRYDDKCYQNKTNKNIIWIKPKQNYSRIYF